jgi:hypothetical protein
VQKKRFQSLRNRGILLPSDGELRDNPLAALHFWRMAEEILGKQAPDSIAPKPQPGQERTPDELQQPQQAA